MGGLCDDDVDRKFFRQVSEFLVGRTLTVRLYSFVTRSNVLIWVNRVVEMVTLDFYPGRP